MNQYQETQFEDYANRYWDSNGPFSALHAMNALRVAIVAEQAQLTGAHVLDFGCGGGLASFELAKHGAAVVGIDANPSMIQVAESKNNATENPVRFLEMKTLDPKHPDLKKKFDVICAFEVFEHFTRDKIDLHIKQFSAMLSKKGIIAITTINRSPVSFLKAIIGAEFILRLLPCGTHRYDYLIRPSELVALGEKQNLKMSTLTPLSFNPVRKKWSRGKPGNHIVNYFLSLQRA